MKKLNLPLITDLVDREFHEFDVGDYVCFERCFDSADFESFSNLSGDRSPLHHDHGYAASTPFGAPIVPLHLAASPFSAIVGMMLPGRQALYLSHELRALRPVPYDKTITYSARIAKTHGARRTFSLNAIAFLDDEVLLEGRILVQVREGGQARVASTDSQGLPVRRIARRRALVTGAAGAIGRTVALALARGGWDLVLQYRDKASIGSLIDTCRTNGADVSGHQAELTRVEDVEGLAAAALRAGPITEIIHCACPSIHSGLDALLSVNYTSLVALGAAIVPEMLKQQDGRILLLGSSSVQHNPKGWEDYVAAKAAASNWVGGLNARYGTWGVSGMVVAPGFVDTPFSSDYRSDDTPAMLPEEVADTIVKSLQSSDGPRGAYVWLEPGVRRTGYFGFHDVSDKPRSKPVAAVTTGEINLQAGSASEEVERLLCEFFSLAEGLDLSNAGIDRLPGWDSLRHIELMLFLEDRLSIQFEATEIERTTNLIQLVDLIAEKRRAES